MVSFNYPVPCPLMGNKEIDKDTCFDIHMVVCGCSPKRFAPEEIYRHKNYVNICNNCQYHRDD